MSIGMVINFSQIIFLTESVCVNGAVTVFCQTSKQVLARKCVERVGSNQNLIPLQKHSILTAWCAA